MRVRGVPGAERWSRSSDVTRDIDNDRSSDERREIGCYPSIDERLDIGHVDQAWIRVPGVIVSELGGRLQERD